MFKEMDVYTVLFLPSRNTTGQTIVFNVPLFDSPNLDIGKNNAATT